MCPIKGITDAVRPAFTTIGKLRKGGAAVKDKDGRTTRPGEDLDHWRFTSDRQEVVDAFVEAYGEAPVSVNVFLPHPDVDSNFSCWKERWSAGGLMHRCDGETQVLWLDKDGKYKTEPRPCDGGCDEVGRLSVLIPELVARGFVGYVTAETHGINDLISIQSALLAAAAAREGNPNGLRGIPWVLRRAKAKVSTPMGGGKRARRDKWLVRLEPIPQWVGLQLETARNEALALAAPQRQNVDTDTGEVYQSTAEEIPDDEPEDDEGVPLPPEPPEGVPIDALFDVQGIAPVAEPVRQRPLPQALEGLDADFAAVYWLWHDRLEQVRTAEDSTVADLNSVAERLKGEKEKPEMHNAVYVRLGEEYKTAHQEIKARQPAQ